MMKDLLIDRIFVPSASAPKHSKERRYPSEGYKGLAVDHIIQVHTVHRHRINKRPYLDALIEYLRNEKEWLKVAIWSDEE